MCIFDLVLLNPLLRFMCLSTSLFRHFLEDLKSSMFMWNTFWLRVLGFVVISEIVRELGSTALEQNCVGWDWDAIWESAIFLLMNELASLTIRTHPSLVIVIAQLCLVCRRKVLPLTKLYPPMGVVACLTKLADSVELKVSTNLSLELGGFWNVWLGLQVLMRHHCWESWWLGDERGRSSVEIWWNIYAS
jgi:hypothetical protein